MKDPVDDYYKPLTQAERDAGVRGVFPPYSEMLGWIRRWEATLRAAEANFKKEHERGVIDRRKARLSRPPIAYEAPPPPDPTSSEGWPAGAHRFGCPAPAHSGPAHEKCTCGPMGLG